MMSYISLTISEEKKQEIQNKLQKYYDEQITDEVLEGYFQECVKGQIKSQIVELFQNKEFKAKLAEKITPLILGIGGIK